MGFPVSIVVAEIIMQNIEEQVLVTYKRTLRSGYVTLTIPLQPYIKTKSTIFSHEHLNEQNVDIKFTKEIGQNGKIPFLDFFLMLSVKEYKLILQYNR